MIEQASVWRAILKLGGTTSSTLKCVKATNTGLQTPVFENRENVHAEDADGGVGQQSLDVRSSTRLFVGTEVTSWTEGSDNKLAAAADCWTVNDSASSRSGRAARGLRENVRILSDRLKAVRTQVRHVSAAPEGTH